MSTALSLPTADDRALVSDLCEALGPAQVHTDGLELALYGRDASLERGEVAAVCFPSTAPRSRPDGFAR